MSENKPVVESKKWYTSKTLWVAIISLAVEILGSPQLKSMFGDSTLQVIAFVNFALMAIMRAITTQPISK